MAIGKKADMNIYPGDSVEDFLGVWRVETINDGSINISDTWARQDHRIALFRFYDRVCMFGDDDFSFNSYEQFHFVYEGGYLVSKNVTPGVQLQVGFSDKDKQNIYFQFSGKSGANSHNSGNGNSSWGGGGGSEP